MPGDPHADDCTYLRYVAKDRNADDNSVAVLTDCDIYWDIAELKNHRPDLAVIFGVKRRRDWPSFDVKKDEGPAEVDRRGGLAPDAGGGCRGQGHRVCPRGCPIT